MRRLSANFAIFLLVAVAVTAVLALSTATDRGGDLDDATTPDDSAADVVDDVATTTAEGAGPSATNADTTLEDGDAPATPDHLETGEEAAVLGVALSQEPETLAETGPFDTLRWMIVASGVIAAGGMVRGAGRDHARGELTLMG